MKKIIHVVLDIQTLFWKKNEILKDEKYTHKFTIKNFKYFYSYK